MTGALSGDPAAVLRGTVVCLLTDEPAAAVCAHHLGQLGAAVVRDARDAADVVLVDESSDPPARCAQKALVCTFEHHRIDGGLVASETTAQAAIGLADYVSDPGRRPARIGCDVGTVVAGICAVQATLAWLHGGRIEGTRHDVAVSPLRALSTLKTILWAARTRPDEWVGPHVTSREHLVDSGYRTLDGRITLDFPVGAEPSWRGFVADLGLDEATITGLQTRWYESVGWGDDVDLARFRYEERLGLLSTDDAVALIRRNGGSSLPFQTLEQCLAHPQAQAMQLDARGASLPWRVAARRRERMIAGALGNQGMSGDTAPFRDPTRPLAGVRVVDFGVGGVGPFAATLLAWLGAEVVKVEAPNEFILTVGPTVGGLSTTYLALNQGKRSVSLNLKDETDRRLALQLVSEADVVIENFRPGALDRIGFGFDELSALNPRLVYCSVTGFGPVGPLAGEPCTDPHMQAFSGFAMGNADERGLPRRIRYYGFVDLVTSMVAAEAVCAALLARAALGGPVRVETSMLEAVTHVLRATPESTEQEPDDFYRAQDGDLALTCRSDRDWLTLVDVLDVESLRGDETLAGADGRRREHHRVRAALEEALRARPMSEWASRLGDRGVPAAPALHDEGILERRDYWAAGLLRNLPLPHAEPLTAAGPPWRLGGPDDAPPAPAPGGDTNEVRAAGAPFWRPRGGLVG